jgi:hypothetical protein
MIRRLRESPPGESNYEPIKMRFWSGCEFILADFMLDYFIMCCPFNFVRFASLQYCASGLIDNFATEFSTTLTSCALKCRILKYALPVNFPLTNVTLKN